MTYAGTIDTPHKDHERGRIITDEGVIWVFFKEYLKNPRILQFLKPGVKVTFNTEDHRVTEIYVAGRNLSDAGTKLPRPDTGVLASPGFTQTDRAVLYAVAAKLGVLPVELAERETGE